jgi:hypothetical protein
MIAISGPIPEGSPIVIAIGVASFVIWMSQFDLDGNKGDKPQAAAYFCRQNRLPS